MGSLDIRGKKHFEFLIFNKKLKNELKNLMYLFLIWKRKYYLPRKD